MDNMSVASFERYQRVRVKYPGFLRFLCMPSAYRALLGRVGIVGMVEVGYYSGKHMYGVIFQVEGGPKSFTFFANELEAVK
ncbi:MAG: hypothetical protein KGI50_01365 [Patescibacteria group bacterium]|nr:hypothetical protein [Patescibacteria group bacterium]MDE2438003.1 hypothetical protein [Patescibacteria group bacterium]